MEIRNVAMLKVCRKTWLIQARDLLILLFVITPVWTYLICSGCRDDLANFGIGASYSFGIWFTQWKGNELLSNWLDHRISWLAYPTKRFIWGIVAVLIYTPLSLVILLYVLYLVTGHYQPISSLGEFLKFVGVVLVITTLISLFLNSRRFLIAWRQTAINAERLKAEGLNSQFQSLKNQVNPHFLFNSLNVLTSLVYKDADEAARFIKKLAEVYRYVLETQNKEVVPLKEELSFIESYVFLSKIRYGENLQVHIDVPSDSPYMVLPLSVQMLLENAIKHNIISNSKPLNIQVVQSNGILSVSNNLQKKYQNQASVGLGLNNIKSRYKFLTDEPLVIESNDEAFTVKLPLLTFS